MNDKELYSISSIITSNFKSLQVKSVEKLGEGWMSKAFLVNKELVFRFPKEKQGAIDLNKEIKVLPLIHEEITISIPDFEYIGKQPNGFPFVGYKILKGDPMNRETFISLSRNAMINLEIQVAKFIRELSSFSMDIAVNCDVPVNSFFNDYLQTLENIKRDVYPIMDEDMRNYITTCFRLYLDNSNNFNYIPTLIHADISLDHLIFNNSRQELVGIIDFGDMEIGDPDYEYLYLLDDCGEEFTKMVMEMNKIENIEEKIEKIRFFLTVDNIGIIQEGIRKQDHVMVRSGLDLIKQEMILRSN